MRRIGLLGMALAAVLSASAPAAARGPGAPGDFDFYVLSLSWSPSYCRTEARASDSQQCRSGRPYGFVVHGLWPQRERGYAQNCIANPPRVDDRTVRGMLDIMPSFGLVVHEWRTHGTCSGLSPQAFFDTTRRAFSRVVIPGEFRDTSRPRDFAPIEIENAFVRANPGLSRDAIAVDCRDRLLREVRICFSKELGFRSCPDVDRRACRMPRIEVPPAR